ncbi:MAG: membrane integrity-associated transporter subunit PqiC, partial [Candidatus Gastranaerophilales bacterium]|nr:membrane integrity-associated transporter subunit PqiC [Candidatus Gastranaerophilales bacterium]
MKTALSCVTLCSLILLNGCLGGVSATPQFFTLQNESNISVVSNQKISVGVLPVKVPDYLDKPQIVLNNGTNQM